MIKRTYEEMIRIQFKRWQRHVPSISLEHQCALALPPDEFCVALINASDGSQYHFTNKAVVHSAAQEAQNIPYKEIIGCYWMPEKTRNKDQDWEKIVLSMKNRQEEVLDNLSHAVFPTAHLFSWFLRQKNITVSRTVD
ncbi:MAG: hypothetical protein KKB21_03630 [Nanoarchaeota archaeon]|nr:hypothetical protein [Nanoarchaeota archaeon]MBU4086639.1 hypothetical protein [Nanoarchaeota archaeon]